jgi:hypothetical protein
VKAPLGMARSFGDGLLRRAPPSNDSLLRLDGNGDGSKAQGLDLGPMALDLGLVFFLFFKINFWYWSIMTIDKKNISFVSISRH